MSKREREINQDQEVNVLGPLLLEGSRRERLPKSVYRLDYQEFFAKQSGTREIVFLNRNSVVEMCENSDMEEFPKLKNEEDWDHIIRTSTISAEWLQIAIRMRKPILVNRAITEEFPLVNNTPITVRPVQFKKIYVLCHNVTLLSNP